MNRIVREHYPVAKLPEDLRQGFEGHTEVCVTINAAGRPAAEDRAEDSPAAAEGGGLPAAPGRAGLFSRFKHLRRANYATIEEAVAHVRALRDEWPDRE